MTTYLDYYNEYIAPSLKAIDLFLKTHMNEKITIDVAMDLLDLSYDEVQDLMSKFHMDSIDQVSFFKIMQNGSSSICKLFSREVQRKLPHFYSFFDISYIYQIPYERVVEAAMFVGITSITNQNIHDLFSAIIIKDKSSLHFDAIKEFRS